MPEGHTIHALAGRLERAFRGEVVRVTSPQGRFAADAERLDGGAFEQADAVGKHLFIHVGPHIVHVHLGLIGTFHVKPRTTDDPAASGGTSPTSTVRLRIEGPDHVAELRGPMICSVIDEERREHVVGGLGPDPLDPDAAPDRAWRREHVVGGLGPDPLDPDADPDAAPDRAWRRIQRSRKPIADLLLEQAVLSGVGNVYRCEVLFRQRVDPMTPGTELGRPLWQRIWADLVVLLPLGVAFSQILTMQDQVDAAVEMVEDGRAAGITAGLTGERLGDYFERRFHVYQRTGEACHRCGRRVRDAQLAGRRLYWCPGCQTRRKR